LGDSLLMTGVPPPRYTPAVFGHPGGGRLAVERRWRPV